MRASASTSEGIIFSTASRTTWSQQMTIINDLEGSMGTVVKASTTRGMPSGSTRTPQAIRTAYWSPTWSNQRWCNRRCAKNSRVLRERESALPFCLLDTTSVALRLFLAAQAIALTIPGQWSGTAEPGNHLGEAQRTQLRRFFPLTINSTPVALERCIVSGFKTGRRSISRSDKSSKGQAPKNRGSTVLGLARFRLLNRCPLGMLL